RREGVGVGIAFGVEAGTGIAVPVPRAADTGARLEDANPETELTQLVELIKAGDAGPANDRVEIEDALPLAVGRRRLRTVHSICSWHRRWRPAEDRLMLTQAGD